MAQRLNWNRAAQKSWAYSSSRSKPKTELQIARAQLAVCLADLEQARNWKRPKELIAIKLQRVTRARNKVALLMRQTS